MIDKINIHNYYTETFFSEKIIMENYQPNKKKSLQWCIHAINIQRVL